MLNAAIGEEKVAGGWEVRFGDHTVDRQLTGIQLLPQLVWLEVYPCDSAARPTLMVTWGYGWLKGRVRGCLQLCLPAFPSCSFIGCVCVEL